MSAPALDSLRLSLEGCYEALAGRGAARMAAEQLLARRHWIHETSDFDERTGELLPDALGAVCARIRSTSTAVPAGSLHDRLYRILDHVHGPLEEILRRLHEGLVRQHASLPLHAVRELDTTSFFALSRRSGRTVREKLADRPYVWAVERRWTVDTLENRLVKAFCARVTELIRTRTRHRQGLEDAWVEDLHATMEAWLRGPAAREIGRWENLPPTNLLLQHRDYRRIWDAWSWILSLDEKLRHDRAQRLAQWMTMAFWTLVARLEGQADVRLLEQPCYLDYERFAIEPARGRDGAAVRIEGVIVDRAANVERTPPGGRSMTVGKPQAFSLELELEPRCRISIWPPLGPAVVLECEESGERVKVHLGADSVTVDLSVTTAIELANEALAALPLSPALRPVAVTGGPATVVSPDAASVAVIDLCTPRPRFAVAGRHGTLPFRLLWQRWQAAGRGAHDLDLGAARAVSLGPNVTTVSVLDLFAAEPEHAPAVLGEASRLFARKLREAVPAEELSYVVPDATDEFVLGTLRRSINAAFPTAEPLPRSIAAVFDWQSSPDFARRAIADGDCVLVLDSVGATISATPLRARRSQELRSRVPESGGIFWERCPSIQGAPAGTAQATATVALTQMGCPYPDRIAALLGLRGLADERTDLSWHHDVGGWFTTPASVEQTIRSVLGAVPDPWSELGRGVAEDLADLGRGARVFVLPCGDVFQELPANVLATTLAGGRRLLPLDAADEPQRGGAVLHAWQKRAGDILLWRDRLPELSMRVNRDGRRARIHLVSGVTVAPKRGSAVPIPIKERFVLPRGQPDYHFPLSQGADDSELRFEAFLRSPAFPLADDILVTLELTYSYGSDSPYELVFVNAERGIRVRAEWRPRSEDDAGPLDAPTPPAPLTWADLQRYPTNRGDTANLLDWIKDDLARIQRRLRTLEARRYPATVTSEWRFDKNGKRYTFAECHAGSVFCHEHDFVLDADVNRVGHGTLLRLEVESNSTSSNLSGRQIALASGRGAVADEDVLIGKIERVIEIMKKGPRFPFRTVWMDGRSLTDADVPAPFRSLMQRAVDELQSIMARPIAEEWSSQRASAVQRLSEGVLYLLCCMHADAPLDVPAVLRSLLASYGPSSLAPWRYGRHVALALGAGRLDWQRQLLAHLLDQLGDDTAGLDRWAACLQVLDIAVWRCGALLAALDVGDIELAVRRVSLVLDHELEQLSANKGNFDPRPLVDHLELVLALLRTRASDDPVMRAVLTPRRPESRKLARTIEKISDAVSEHDVRITSRISLSIDKPPALHRTPDLIYALQLYLTGDDSARSIHVVSVRADDDAPGGGG